MRTALLPCVIALAACGGSQNPPPPNPPPLASTASATATASATPPVDTAPTATPPANVAPKMVLTSKPVALPGANGPVSLDYLVADHTKGVVWVPAGGTGNVDVIDGTSGNVTTIAGFPTVEREVRGQKRKMGTSSATVGDGVVYVGNRANSQICAIDAAKMTKGACITLKNAPDGIQYVASVKELWATTPKDNSLTILDASDPAKLKAKTTIKLDGGPEGYAIDNAKGVFYTNLEEKNKTLVIDVKTHKVTATWEPKCGSDGPRGLSVDGARNLLIVACTDHVVSLDTAHDGAVLSQLDTGAGVDNIDYLDARQQLFVVSGKEGKMTVAKVDDKGAFSVVATGPTAEGTRVVAVDGNGTAYVADGKQGRILIMTMAPSP